jgi:carboxymethylenebutenolidase
METMENYLTVEVKSGLMDLYVTAPASVEGKLPVVIVFQEAFGVNNHIKNICQRLSTQGFMAVAPELYHRQGRHVIIDYADRKAFLPLMGTLSNESLLEDVKDTLDFLGDLPVADISRIFTLGFCMGGFASLLSATQFPLCGCVSFYGAGVVHARDGIGLTPFLNNFKNISCPVLLFFGEEDASISRQEREEIEKCLKRWSKDYQIKVFEQSDHGFFCDERKSFNQRAAFEAWKLTLGWMKKN